MKNQNMFSGYQDESQGDKKSELPIIKILGISTILTFILMMTFDAFVGAKVPQVSSEIFYVYPTPPDIFFAIWPVIFILLFVSLCLVYWYSAWNIRTFLSMFVYFASYIIWIYFFSTGTKYGISICTIDLFIITLGLYLTWKNSFDIDAHSKAQKFIRSSLAFQMGWTASAQCLNLCIFFVYICDMSQKSTCYLIWIYLIISHGSMSNFAYNQCKRDKQRFIENFGSYYISCSWALIGATISIINNY